MFIFLYNEGKINGNLAGDYFNEKNTDNNISLPNGYPNSNANCLR